MFSQRLNGFKSLFITNNTNQRLKKKDSPFNNNDTNFKKFFRIKTALTGLVSVGVGLALTQPAPASTVVGELAIVYNPPSNIRVEPNGTIICQIKEKKTISIYRFTNNVNTPGSPKDAWYSTNACGDNQMGWIHQSQIQLTGKYHPPR